MSSVHSYRSSLRWRGSTGLGYDEYDRTHQVAATGKASLTMASDKAFLGDPALINPEDLLVMAASSCQLLSFLAVAARARLDVLDYTDEALGEMPEAKGPLSLTRILLRPKVILATGSRTDRLERLTRLAHQECYIANSLRSSVEIEAEFSIDGQIVAGVEVRD